MRTHTCPNCGQLVFFDNLECLACHNALAFRPSSLDVVGVTADDRRCQNVDVIGCNWLVEDGQELCLSCRLTTVRPPDGDSDAMVTWVEAEQAKRILVAQCLDLDLDISGVTFELRSGEIESVITGHADGVITIDVQEADDVNRTKMREQMGEAYRTMLGHFRHETGHYLWMTMVDGTDNLEGFRDVFGDDRIDYGEALEAHYGSDDPEGWEDEYVSVYATAHPWEDFAETLAHYLHIRSTLQTAGEFGISVHGDHPALEAAPADADPDHARIGEIVAQWLPLTYALNAVNRSMGLRPVYPFVLAPAVITKLGWVHRLVEDASR